MISITVAGNPIPKGSMKGFNRGGRVILTSDNPRLKDWHHLVAWAAQEQGKMLAGPLEVHMLFTLSRPASISAKKRPHPVVKPDVDKLARAVMDALTGICWTDDAQVVRLVAFKRYEAQPGVEITIEELPC